MSMKLTREDCFYCCAGRPHDPKYFKYWDRSMMHSCLCKYMYAPTLQ